MYKSTFEINFPNYIAYAMDMNTALDLIAKKMKKTISHEDAKPALDWEKENHHDGTTFTFSLGKETVTIIRHVTIR